MSASLPELSPVEVYVIQILRLADDFLNSATSLVEKKPAFVQSLHKINCYTYLKDEAYYGDLYDRQTIEECRNMKKRFAEAATGTPAEQQWQTLLVKVALYFLRGERYAQKADTVMFWRENDRQRDRHLAQAEPPRGIRCINCFSDMVCEEKDLLEWDGVDQVLFFFNCPKCASRRAFYEDGTEYRRKKVICKHCQSEAKVEYQHPGEKVSIVTTCPKCGKMETG